MQNRCECFLGVSAGESIDHRYTLDNLQNIDCAKSDRVEMSFGYIRDNSVHPHDVLEGMCIADHSDRSQQDIEYARFGRDGWLFAGHQQKAARRTLRNYVYGRD